MSINLNDNIKLNAGKPLDSKYLNGISAYASIAEVNAIITISERYLGLTVLVGTNEYWYHTNITDIGLVIKSTSSSGGGVIYTQNGYGITTTLDNQQMTLLTIDTIPLINSHPKIEVNGVDIIIGDGVKNKPCYVSNDNGITAKSLINIELNDTLHWNGSIAGYEIDSSDIVKIEYLT